MQDLLKGLNVLTDTSKIPKLRFMMMSAVLAAGIAQMGLTAAAEEDANVSERDMLEQAVVLYERLSGSEVEVPNVLADRGGEFLGKSAMLGFINADEIDDVSSAVALRKQDVMTILYKTVIDFDDSYALSSSEVDEILNRCYDNALIDEENRVGYAFMIKHGIISEGTDTEPNKTVTWSSCSILVDLIYDMFMQEVSVDISDTTVAAGANIETVTDVWGEPDRIDKGDCGFDWYVYNSDYSRFAMIGVSEGRICAFYTNAQGFRTEGITEGDDYLLTYKYADSNDIVFYSSSEGTVDAVLYNPHAVTADGLAEGGNTRAYQLADMINAYRVKKGMEPLELSEKLWNDAADMAVQPKYWEYAERSDVTHETDGAVHETGFSIFTVYSKYINETAQDKDAKIIGVGTTVPSGNNVAASIIVSDKAGQDDAVTALSGSAATELPFVETVKKTEEDTVETAEKAEITKITEETEADGVPQEAPLETAVKTIALGNDLAPSQESLPEETPAPETAAADETETETGSRADEAEAAAEDEETNGVKEIPFRAGEDLELDTTELAAEEIYVRIYSIEDDKYIVDSYMSPSDGKLVLDAKLFENGKDYSVELTGGGAENTFIVSCGEAMYSDVKILTPEADRISDSDQISVSWESGLYHDFIIDIYDSEGKLVLSEKVADSYEAKISGVQPGDYYIYVSAVRRGDDTNTLKSQDGLNFTIERPEPIITEYVLDEGEKFYPAYEDEEMGIVRFYDEDFVDVDVTDKNGRVTTVKKKKITEKQVKATDEYKRLAASQQKVECFTGSSQKDIKEQTTVSAFNGIYSRISLEGSSELGEAIVAEASKYLGVPYLWGGTTPSGFDCSGLVQYVCRSLGIEISRVSQDQYYDGVPVSRDELQPGDLVFFQSGGDVHHVGIYAGDGMMIHAPYTGSVVKYQSIETPYYSSSYCGARRVAF